MKTLLTIITLFITVPVSAQENICPQEWLEDTYCDCGCGVFDSACLGPEFYYCEFVSWWCEYDNIDPDNNGFCL